MFKAIAKLLHIPEVKRNNYADPLLERLWQQDRVIQELTQRLEREQESHRRTRAVYRSVLGVLRKKFVGIDVMISQAAREYDRK